MATIHQQNGEWLTTFHLAVHKTWLDVYKRLNG